ncbi:MAG: CapA family protein [Paraclostridium sp.]
MAKKINKKKAILLMSTIGLCILTFLLMLHNNRGIKEVSNFDTVKDVKEEIPKEVEKKSIKISFAGDVTMGNYKGSPYYGSFDNEFENQNQNYGYFFENVKMIFEEDDLTIVNLEGPLTSSTNAKVKKFAFKGNPLYVNILKEGNVEAVTLANNHSEDYFEEGFEETKFILKENEIEYFGLGEKNIVDVNGVSVGLLGYNGWSENYNEQFISNMKREINDFKNESDIVIAYFHWGTERKYYPDKVQRDFAYTAIDSGADAVIGSHPHVIQGVEKYNGKYIAYSLGNFCFGGNKNPSDKDSLIYQLTFNFKDNNLVEIEKPNIIPCVISSTKNRNDYKPTPTSGSESDRIIKKLTDISNTLNE